MIASDWARYVSAFRRGLRDVGYVEGDNVIVEARWANNQYDRLPDMAAELVQRQVTVIVAFSTPAAHAAKAAATKIPIVFTTNRDPEQIGLVASLSRPGGNMTGATNLGVEVEPKLLALLHDVVPSAKIIALLRRSKRAHRNFVTRFPCGVIEQAYRQLREQGIPLTGNVTPKTIWRERVRELEEKKARANGPAV